MKTFIIQDMKGLLHIVHAKKESEALAEYFTSDTKLENICADYDSLLQRLAPLGIKKVHVVFTFV